MSYNLSLSLSRGDATFPPLVISTVPSPLPPSPLSHPTTTVQVPHRFPSRRYLSHEPLSLSGSGSLLRPCCAQRHWQRMVNQRLWVRVVCCICWPFRNYKIPLPLQRLLNHDVEMKNTIEPSTLSFVKQEPGLWRRRGWRTRSRNVSQGRSHHERLSFEEQESFSQPPSRLPDPSPSPLILCQ